MAIRFKNWKPFNNFKICIWCLHNFEVHSCIVNYDTSADIGKYTQKYITVCNYWVIQNDCGRVWQLCTKIYVATVWVG
jgi:hypothetical protein